MAGKEDNSPPDGQARYKSIHRKEEKTMAANMKQQVLQEIDSRLKRPEEHQNDRIHITGNQYEELNQALSKVIGVPLMEELKDLKSFVQSL